MSIFFVVYVFCLTTTISFSSSVYAQPITNLEKACDDGDKKECRMVGYRYLLGLRVPKDKLKAAKWYEKGCNSDNTENCISAANIYTDEDVDQYKFKVNELYQIACDGGDSDGCTNLGIRYHLGKGVRKDVFKAFELYKKVCEDGQIGHSRVVACSNLGVMYESGEGVRQDIFKATELYDEACLLNSAHGCNNLGTLYESGESVRQDKAKALLLFGKACDLKLEAGCINYAKLKTSGVR